MNPPKLRRVAYKIGLTGGIAGTALGALLFFLELKTLGMVLLISGWLAVFIGIIIQRYSEQIDR